MLKRPQQSVCDVLRDFFQPCPLDTGRALNRARDDLLYRFITEHDCTSCPADWPLHQLREFYRVMVPIIADSYCNDGAAERFPVIQKLLKTHTRMQADDRIQNMHNQLRQCANLHTEVETFLQLYIPSNTSRKECAQPKKRCKRYSSS